MNHPLTLAEMQRIRQWHVAHRDDHPLEYQVWDLLLTLWVMGWLGWLPGYALDAEWAWPLCLLAMMAPRLYVAWRRHAHRLRRLRCDWLGDKA
jgi:hypothetical protein